MNSVAGRTALKGLNLLLAGALAASFSLTACSAQKKPAGQSGTSAAHAAFTATFIATNPLQQGVNPSTYPGLQKLEKEANVTVSWQVYSQSAWNEKKSVVLSSGDLPDVFYGMSALKQSDIAKYSAGGLFYDLDSYIDKGCPNLNKAFDEIPSFRAVCTNPGDGKIYSIGRAAQRNAQDISDPLFINKKWLDELNLKVPSTIEEFKTDLEAFKTQDPNHNGKADEVPFSFAMAASYSYSNLFDAFGYGNPVVTASGGNKFIEDEKKQAVYTPTTSNYKAAVQFLHQLFAEGLIDKEGFSSQDNSKLTALGNSSEEILGSFASFDVANVISQSHISDYVPIPPFTGVGGKKLWVANASNGNVNGPAFAISKTAKNPAAIMRWLDGHFDPSISIELFLGPVGTTLKKSDSGGMLDYLPTPSGTSYSAFRFKYAPTFVPLAIPNSSWGKTVAVMGEDVNRNNWLKNIYGEHMTQKYIFPYATVDESKFVQSTGADIDQYAQTQESNWLVNGGIEHDWDAFQKKLNDMGLPQYTKTMQNQIDRFDKVSKGK